MTDWPGLCSLQRSPLQALHLPCALPGKACFRNDEEDSPTVA